MNKTIILLMLFLFIPSCGWQLKGNNYLSPDIENVDITVQSLDPQINIKFKSILLFSSNSERGTRKKI